MQRTLNSVQKSTQLMVRINGTLPGISTIYDDLSMATTKEYPEKYGWWISELNSLGVNTEAKNDELRDVQALENLTDEVKQNFIHEYKTHYSEE